MISKEDFDNLSLGDTVSIHLNKNGLYTISSNEMVYQFIALILIKDSFV